ncbi:MAG: cupin domain-containing protein [Acidimicrobiales bacterium]|nr:cupin domain-containing protein [Acidimicrobiales bacterium]
MIENPRTGERVEVIDESSDALVMLTTWTRSGQRAHEHVHPGMQERFEVLEGVAAFRVDGVEVTGGPGTVVVVPPGKPHLAWNPTDTSVRLRVEMRPGLRWVEFTERLFAGEDPVELLQQFADEVRLPTA